MERCLVEYLKKSSELLGFYIKEGSVHDVAPLGRLEAHQVLF